MNPSTSRTVNKKKEGRGVVSVIGVLEWRNHKEMYNYLREEEEKIG